MDNERFSAIEESIIKPNHVVTSIDDPINDLTEKIYSIKALLSKISTESSESTSKEVNKEKSKDNKSPSKSNKDLSEKKCLPVNYLIMYRKAGIESNSLTNYLTTKLKLK